MAEVYLAIQQSVEREVALKILAPDLAGDPAFSERFISEARIASRLVHPNIVTIYDVGIEGPYHYLSMEYIPGRDLKQARYSLPLSKRLAVVKDIAQALGFAGRKGYVHRDVKPDNIMLHADDGRAVLMDFGIARPSGAAGGMTQTGTTMGTPHYMSPEQARGWEVDPRSDLYSLGIVLYLLLVGRVPFDADSPVAVGVQHVSEPIPLLSPELAVFQPILNQILAKDPEQRYQSGEQLIAALDALPADELEALEHGLFQPAAADSQISPDSSGSVDYCSDSDPTVAVTLPTVTRLSPPGLSHTYNQAAVGYSGAAGYTGKERRVNPHPLPAEPVWLTTEPSAGASKYRHWPWWVGILFAAAVGYGVYMQQQLLAEAVPVTEALATLRLTAEAPETHPLPVAEPIAEGSGAEGFGAADPERQNPEVATPLADGPGVQPLATPLTAQTGDPPAAEVLEQLPPARQVELLTARAQRQHLQGDILMPPNANELHSWRQVLDLDSAHEIARQSVERIEQGLINDIEFQMAQERWHDARASIAQAMVYFPASKRLQVLKLRNEDAVLMASQPKIERVLVSHRSLLGVDQPQAAFLPAEHTLHVGFAFENFRPGTAVVEAHLVEAEQQVELATVVVPITRSEGQEFLSFESFQQAFADGQYRVDLTLDGQLLASSVFAISHPPRL